MKRFRKATCPLVERLASTMMMHGRNNGKKLMTVRIVKHAFEIIHLLTGEASDFHCSANFVLLSLAYSFYKVKDGKT